MFPDFLPEEAWVKKLDRYGGLKLLFVVVVHLTRYMNKLEIQGVLNFCGILKLNSYTVLEAEPFPHRELTKGYWSTSSKALLSCFCSFGHF